MQQMPAQSIDSGKHSTSYGGIGDPLAGTGLLDGPSIPSEHEPNCLALVRGQVSEPGLQFTEQSAVAPILFLTHEQEERALRIDRLRVLANPWIIVKRESAGFGASPGGIDPPRRYRQPCERSGTPVGLTQKSFRRARPLRRLPGARRPPGICPPECSRLSPETRTGRFARLSPANVAVAMDGETGGSERLIPTIGAAVPQVNPEYLPVASAAAPRDLRCSPSARSRSFVESEVPFLLTTQVGKVRSRR